MIRDQSWNGKWLGKGLSPSVEISPHVPLGDYFGDGKPDVFIGAQEYKEREYGIAWLLRGSRVSRFIGAGWVDIAAIAEFRLLPVSDHGGWGASNGITWLGDINGDGRMDFAASDYLWPSVNSPDGYTLTGRVTLFY